MIKFNCCLIGKDNLLIQCAEILLNRGHSIQAIFSETVQVQHWAKKNDIPCIALTSNLKIKNCDYLFSIVNDHILHDEILNQGQKLTINYHDSFLPFYAGVHATSWAILNSEDHHGVSWHIVDKGIDTGAILKQNKISISDGDTTFSLNLKCYEEAILSFCELIEELEINSYVPIPQENKLRTYYGLHKKPPANGVIDWNTPATKIDACIRGLNFGRYENKLSLPKILINGQIFIINQLKLLSTKSQDTPGTIQKITETGIEVSTATTTVSIESLKMIDGKECNLVSWCTSNKIKSGDVFPSLNKENSLFIENKSASISKHESFWVKQWLIKQPTSIGLLTNADPIYSNNIYIKMDYFYIDKVSLDQLKELINKPTRPYAPLLSLWLIYLYRINDYELTCIAFDNYKTPTEFSSIFSNTVPLLLKIEENMTFIECLELLEDKILEIEKNETYLTDIQLRYPKIQSSPNSLIAVIITNNFESIVEYTHIPFILVISEDGMRAQFFLKESLVSAHLVNYIKNIKSHLLALMSGIIEGSKTVKNLPIVLEEEYKKITTLWNQTATPYPKNKTVHQLFIEQVEKTPKNIAVIFQEKKTSYEELNYQSNQLAHYLIDNGVKANSSIGIFFERGLDTIISMLAIAKVGAAYVPIDINYPDIRIQYIIKDSGVVVLLSISKYAARLHNNNFYLKNIIFLDDDHQDISLRPCTNPCISATSNNRIYIMYTSGSTGEPKGVEISHKNVVRLVKNTNYLEIDETDRVAHTANSSFDAATFEIWMPLLNGALLVIFTHDTVLDAYQFKKQLNKNKISTLWLTSDLFSQFIEIKPDLVDGLKNLLVGGDVVSLRTIRTLFKRKNRPLKVINGYGPTENTTFTTYYLITDPFSLISSIPIGIPVSNTQVYVCDRRSQLLPIGIAGELYVGGDGLAHGYLNKLELTLEKFIKNPFDKQCDSRLYKTGDLVRWLPDGNLEYIGRIDNQVKIRGFRIELGEIEAALLTYPHTSRALVLLQEIEKRPKKLYAFVILDKNQCSSDELQSHHTNLIKDFLKDKLPDYLIPHGVIVLNEFPLTTNGKIDRKKLLENNKEISHNNRLVNTVGYTNNIHHILCDIWCKLFELDEISIHDNFFNLGGDSIVAMQMASKAIRLNMHITVKLVFQYPTIETLAQHVTFLTTGENKPLIKRTGFIQLTPIQTWFFDNTKYTKKAHFSQACLLSMRAPITYSEIKRCINALSKKYDAFKLRFSYEDGSWKQFYKNNNDNILFFPLITAPNLLDNEEKNYFNVISQKLQENFNLENGPLFSVALIKKDADFFLILVAHHLIFDGISWRIFLNDLESLILSNKSNEKRVELITSSSFNDWSLALTDYSKIELHKINKAYWLNLIQSPSFIPLDYNNANNLEKNNKIIQACLSQKQTSNLIHLIGKHYKLKIHELLLGVLIYVLGTWSKNKSICIDLENHGREDILTDVNVENTIGWFTSLFPFNLDWDENKSVLDNVFLVKSQLSSIPKNGIDYGILRYMDKEERTPGCQPQVSFNYWGHFDHLFLKDSIFQFNWVRLISHEENERPHLLDIEAAIDSYGQLQISSIYNTKIHKDSTIKKLISHYMRSLKIVLNDVSNFSEFNPKCIVNTQLLNESVRKKYLLTELQKGLLFHTVNTPGCEAYAVQLVFNLDDSINIEMLRQAFNVLIKRQSILRMNFEWEAVTEPFQYARPESEVIWHKYDWSDLSSNEKTIRLNAFLKIDRQANFSLSNAPLVRITAIKLAAHSYTFIICTHHILLDGWSTAILINELGHIYCSINENIPLELQEPVNFSDYIDWLYSHDLNIAKKAWKQYLSGFYLTTDSGLVNREGIHRLVNYANESLVFSKEITNKVNDFCIVKKITLSTLIQGLWGLLLGRYSNTDDIIFGVTVSIRPPHLAGGNKIIGPLINTIPMRIKIDHSLLMTNYLKYVQNNFVELIDYAYVPLTQIQASSELCSSNPLFETIIVVENYPMSVVPGLNIHFEDIKIYDPTHYPLALTITLGTKLQIKFSYDSSRIKMEKINHLLSNFQALLLNTLENSSKIISNIPLLSRDEEQLLKKEWNNTSSLFSKSKTVHQLVEEQVAKTPFNIAISYKAQRLNYFELNEKANQIAHYIRKIGLKNEAIVALCVNRGLNMIISMLGILKSGSAYLPIDPTYPEERIQYMLDNSKTQLLLTDSIVFKEKNHSNKDIKIILLDDHLKIFENESKVNPGKITDSNGLSYVIYTSGSTGKPKGVLIEHHSVVNLLEGMDKEIKVSSDDKWLAITSISFDISGLEIYLPLIRGAQCIIADQETIIDGKKFKQTIDSNHISILQATPMSWKILLEAGWHNKTGLKILCGGEPLTKKLCQQFLEITDYFWNLYGPTETTIWSTCNYISKENSAYSILPIGKPIANTDVYVLDSHLDLQPIGVKGELYIGGEGVARGYLYHNALTKERFIPNKYCSKKISRLYKTGDLVRWLPNGNLEYIERIDDQIKIRGFRIELGEIQAHVESYGCIEKSIVLAIDNINIIACVIIKNNANYSHESLRDHLKKFLPSYMIPNQFVVFKHFPLTPNLKIDKQALARMITNDSLMVNNSFEKNTPSTYEEQTISKVWSDVLLLPFDRIGCHDNFFDLGGHSLTALQVVSMLSIKFSLDLDVRILFEHSSITRLAQKIKSLLCNKFALTEATKVIDDKSISTCLVPLKLSGTKPPLFLIHPVGGTVFWYISLAKYFDINRPLYGIQDPGIESEKLPFSTTSEMAAYYIKAIRTIQPQGPYLIGGASAGANVSMEIAWQLNKNSEDIAAIVLLDGWAYYPKILESEEIFDGIMLRQYNMMKKKFESKGITAADKLLKLQWERSKMNNHYIPHCLNNKLFLFKAQDTMPIFQMMDDSFNHWKSYSTETIEVEMVPGDHETMFEEENAQILAHLLNKKISVL